MMDTKLDACPQKGNSRASIKAFQFQGQHSSSSTPTLQHFIRSQQHSNCPSIRTWSVAKHSSRSNSSRAGGGGSLMAGGNTAGCNGGKGASNWGWIRVNACFFTPSLSYKAIACVQRTLLCFWGLQQLANVTDFKLDDVTMNVYRIRPTDHMSIMVIFGLTLNQMQAFILARASAVLMCTNAIAKTLSKCRSMTQGQTRCLLPQEPFWC